MNAEFIRQLNTNSQLRDITAWRYYVMEKLGSPQSRKRLQKMIMETFTNEIHTLTPELQTILADDMVTAFENRLTVFQRIQSKSTIYSE